MDAQSLADYPWVLYDFEFPSVREYAVEAYHNGNLFGSETFVLARQEETT